MHYLHSISWSILTQNSAGPLVNAIGCECNSNNVDNAEKNERIILVVVVVVVVAVAVGVFIIIVDVIVMLVIVMAMLVAVVLVEVIQAFVYILLQ
jgi:hypothetical protein